MKLNKIIVGLTVAAIGVVGTPSAYASTGISIPDSEATCPEIEGFAVANLELGVANADGVPVELTIEVTTSGGTQTYTTTVPSGASVLNVALDEQGTTTVKVTYYDVDDVFLFENLDPCDLPDPDPLPEEFDYSLAARCNGEQAETNMVLTNNWEKSLVVGVFSYDSEGDLLGGLPVEVDPGETIAAGWQAASNVGGTVGIYLWNGAAGGPTLLEVTVPDCAGSGAGLGNAGSTSALWFSLAGLLLVFAGSGALLLGRRPA